MSEPDFLKWSWNLNAAEDLVGLMRIADKYFEGDLTIWKTRGKWVVMFGHPPLTIQGIQEMRDAPWGLTFMAAVKEALRRAAPLSEE